MQVAVFVVELEGPDEFPADEGSADELARLEMRATREIDAQLTLAIESADLPGGFAATVRRAE